MKYFLINILCLFPFFSYAQQGFLKGDIDTKNFPEISFIWNEYNPNILDASQFSVKENGIEVATKTEHFEVDSIQNKPKSILILWEDQPLYKQLDFTQQVLLYFIKDISVNATNDTINRFNIATFNRQQGNDAILNIGLPEFTNNLDAITDFLANWDYSGENSPYYRKDNKKPIETDFLLALKEGLDLLGKEPKNNTRAIVVITAGLSSKLELSPIIINQSLQHKIPIYVILYPTSENKSKSALQQLSIETYGQPILSDGNPELAKEELLKSFNELNRRHYGQDYKIIFTSQLNRDGKSYPLEFSSIGINYDITRYYKTPDFSLAVWVKEHLILFLILLVIIIAIITLGVIFGIKFFRKRKALITNQKQGVEKQKKQQVIEHKNLKDKLDATQKELKKQQELIERKERELREQKQKEQLTKRMRAKNIQPRLIAVNDGVAYNIDTVTTTVGRETDNNIVLSNPTVSGYHAKIIFNGSSFEIHDLNSTNGVFVNGNRIESAELESSDIIQFGEEVDTKFYL